jgi:hypothetical protein
MSESQAFFLLAALCDRILPGYYSTTMYGTLLDQRVFESLVERTMPVLWEHLVKSDVQLSVVSLPWFLSLYINSMPLTFAFRVLDVFFLEGPKVLFQVGLAILRINGEELLDAADDGAFISILKAYFSRLDESAHPKSDNEKLRAVTRFQELMVVSFKEFAGITQASITELRDKHKNSVLENIENFAKRTQLRNLGPDSKKLSVDDLSILYDRFNSVLYDRQMRRERIADEKAKLDKSTSKHESDIEGQEVGRVGLGPASSLMDYDAFREFLAGISKWAITDSPTSPKEKSDDHSYFSGPRRRKESIWGNGPEPTDHEFMQRLYQCWRTPDASGLNLQNIVTGMAHIKGTKDIMANISYFFDLYDDDKDGRVDREGILRISEALLFLSRRGLEGASSLSLGPNGSQDELSKLADQREISPDERFLSSVSAFIRRCFEYADAESPSATRQNSQAPAHPDSFAIGDDEDDLIDINDKGLTAEPESITTPNIGHLSLSTGNTKQTPRKLSKAEAANAALDPANPLYITLPTFRMVILADELLQHFFEYSFPHSFHLSATLSSETSSPFSLTTFSNMSFPRSAIGSPTTSARVGNLINGATARQLPSTAVAARGLRGVLDNIVNDSMRVAVEVKRRMDEAQKEMERNALANIPNNQSDLKPGANPAHVASAAPAGLHIIGSNSDDEDDDEDEKTGIDQDLLGGVEADVASVMSKNDGDSGSIAAEKPQLTLLDPHAPQNLNPRSRSASQVSTEAVEFER